MFSYLQQAVERNFSSSYSRNPESTIKCTPVFVFAMFHRKLGYHPFSSTPFPLYRRMWSDGEFFPIMCCGSAYFIFINI